MLRVAVTAALRTVAVRSFAQMPAQQRVFAPLVVSAHKQMGQIRQYSAKAPLTKKTLEERIVLVLSLYDKIDAKKLTLDSDFTKDLGLDSLDHVEVVMAIEEEFGFEIPDGDADRFKTPRDIFQYIADKEDVFE
uniref:Acyl carrier protein n=1 Tax=Caenorhabditis japonica TaxID=281687 RepID=A0A8R1HKN3_CAEJA